MTVFFTSVCFLSRDWERRLYRSWDFLRHWAGGWLLRTIGCRLLLIESSSSGALTTWFFSALGYWLRIWPRTKVFLFRISRALLNLWQNSYSKLMFSLFADSATDWDDAVMYWDFSSDLMSWFRIGSLPIATKSALVNGRLSYYLCFAWAGASLF